MRLLANQDRDFTEWHGGCRRALVWAIDADLPEVHAVLADARNRLDGLLIGRYQRQPHITLAYAGLEPEPGATPKGRVYLNHHLATDIDAASALNLEPFDVVITHWDTFPLAPYLGVKSPQSAVLRAAFGGTTQGYVPHVTIGLYAVTAELADVKKRMSGFDPPPITVRVDRLHLLAYEAADIAGRLTTVGTLSLGDGAWRT